MYHSDTEILFPMRVAPALRDLRGWRWRRLVDRSVQAPEAALDQLAFTLLMIRLAGCLTCHPDSYRALRGCTTCATQVIRRFRGEDEELVAQFQRAKSDVSLFLSGERIVMVRTPEPAISGHRHDVGDAE
ncbi:MAG TPA: hypothetical protein VFI11_04625 [Anaerolineales bacterium]|nr:hypothetical protein [Anaerolineales bacterium]